MHGCTRAALALTIALSGCQRPDVDDAGLLLGQRERMLADVGVPPLEEVPQEPAPGRAQEAYRAVQERITNTPPAGPQKNPRPGGELAPSSGPSASMAAASLERQAPLAAVQAPPPAAAPVVDWVRVASVQGGSTEADVPRSLGANVPSAGQAAPELPPAQSSILERAVRGDPNDLRQQLRLRYLYLSEGRPDKATALPEGMDPARARQLMTWVGLAADAETLIDGAPLSPEVVRRFEELAAIVQAKADLEVSRVELCSSIQSFGRFESVPDDFFVCGAHNRVYIYCELRNFASTQSTLGHEVRIAHRLELLDRAGNVLWQDPQFIEVQDSCNNRRTDFFFNRFWQLPAALPAGEYVLNVIVEDRLKSQLTEAKKPLTVRLP